MPRIYNWGVGPGQIQMDPSLPWKMSTCGSRLSFFSLFSFRLLSFSAFSSSVFSFFRNWNIFTDYLITFSTKIHHFSSILLRSYFTFLSLFYSFFQILNSLFYFRTLLFLDYYFILIFEFNCSCNFLNERECWENSKKGKRQTVMKLLINLSISELYG